ncbi:serine/threonine-protein kinase [Actinomadura sp. 6K520]|uniref:serine/threonine-protein kinase n=1 Tax=Actinomadura sp. 6K520 TaxID=2530364 RepID=UPI001404C74B|nr:serine/threonine-protein kinase [Actinomadura sp. 6K520]
MRGDRLIPLARRYRLLSVVGRGGMGTVWRAYDEMLDRDVAVKEVRLPARITRGERRVMCRRLLAEARATAALRHPGVVAVHDFIIEDGRPWIVMEFVEACSLNRLVAEDGPLGVRRTAEIGAAVLSVLRASHAAGILHRDVKPSNVLVCDDGRILLTDFGLAVHMAGGRQSADTMPAGIEGSPAYLSPERVNGMPGGEASDLWSLGATLYMAVEGFAPFLRCHALASMMAVVLGDYAPPERAGPLTPLIEGLLRQRPEERLTAGATAELLGDVLGTVPEPGATVAKPATAPHRPRGISARLPLSRPGTPGVRDGPRSRVLRGPRVPWALRGGRPPGDVHAKPPCGSRRFRGRWRSRDAWGPRHPALRHPEAAARVPAGRRVRPGAVAGVAALAVLAAVTGTWTARWTSVGKSDSVALRPAAGVTVKMARYREAGAYSVRVPVGWHAERSGAVMQWKDVEAGHGLRIAPAPGDPLAGLRAAERAAVAEHRYPGYHRLRLESVPEVIAGAAEWEFTWKGEPGQAFADGVRHVLCSRAAGYEFCFYAPDRRWTPGQRLYGRVLESFRPESG